MILISNRYDETCIIPVKIFESDQTQIIISFRIDAWSFFNILHFMKLVLDTKKNLFLTPSQ